MKADTITTQKTWDHLCDRVNAPLQQRWVYGAAATRLGRSVHRIVVTDEGIPVAFVQVVSRHVATMNISLATRGPMFLEDTDRTAVLRCIKRALPFFSLKLMTPMERLRWHRVSRKTSHCHIDLSVDFIQLRQNLHIKWRNGLRKSENSRLKVTQIQARSNALMPLLQAEKDRQAVGHYSALPPEFSLVIQDVAPKSLRLLSASDAQMLFIRHGNSATYHIGYTGPKGRDANAHNLILWHAICLLKKEGVTRLDLGTVDKIHAPDLARFKLRTGAETQHGYAACLL